MKQKRFIPLLLAGLLLVLLIRAQAVDAWHWPTAGAQSPPTPADHPAEATAITTLRWFTRWDAERLNTVAMPLLAQFHAEQPTIRVLVENVSRGDEYYRQLRLQLDRGQPPDIFYPATHIAYELQQRGQLLALDSLLRADALALTAYGQAPLQLYGDETAQLYCLPVDVATLAVVYNRTLFEAAGLAYPQAPWTWDDLLATAAQLTADDGDGAIDHYGVDRFYSYWPLLVWSATGHNVFDHPQHPTTFLLEEEASIEAVQWLADLHLEHGVMPPIEGGTGVENLFLAGRAAMQVTGYWQVPSYRAAELDIDVVPLPIGEYAVNRSDGSCLALAATSAHPQEAWTFLKFLAGPTGIGARMAQDQQAQSPAMTALYQQSFFINPLNLPAPDQPARATPASAPPLTADRPTQITFPLYDPLHPLFAEWQPIAERELLQVWRGRRSADAAIGRMANAAEDLLEDLPLPGGPTIQGRQATERPNSVTVRPPLSSTIQLTGTAAAALSATQFMTTAGTSTLAAPDHLPRHYFVAPTGDNAHSGLQATTPWATIQHALDHVQAGDTVHLAAGDYFENLTSVTVGRADAPITLMGPPDAVLRGTGKASAAFYLTHDYYTLTGFTIDGLFGDPDTKEGYTQKLLYVQGKGVKSGVTGLRVLHMRFQNAGGECLRLRYFAQHNEIAYSTFQVCGLLDFAFVEGGKNGEAIYIGTATDQWADGKNPTADPDESHHNWVHHNVMDTRGNECVEIKEGGYANLIEHNLCTGQLDPDSAGIGARGNDNIIRYNTIYSNVGAAIRLGGHEVAGIQYGVHNDVYGNSLLGNIVGGVKIVSEPQNRICSNRLERNVGKQVFGEGRDNYEPAAPC